MLMGIMYTLYYVLCQNGDLEAKDLVEKVEASQSLVEIALDDLVEGGYVVIKEKLYSVIQ